MLRNTIGLLLVVGTLGAAQAEPAAKDVCTAPSAEAAFAAYQQFGSALPEFKVASRSRYIAADRLADVLLYRPYEKASASGSEGIHKLAYRIIVVDKSDKPVTLLPNIKMQAEAATQGKWGTDFSKEEPKVDKTLLSFTLPLVDSGDYQGPPWKGVRLHIIGCDASMMPQAKAWLELPRSNIVWSRSLAILLCVFCYLFAATGTYYVHKRQRIDPHKRDPRQPNTGTNYANWWKHLNPVVLTAGSNGLGSATKLQILFFSLLIFGVVSYIWILSGHLTEMSSSVLLLMGISGIGATAAAGTEVAKNRIDFDNWSWLVNRGWLPKGGVAEENMAKWKDIVTTGGEFDATRFQMITFSLLVGGALLTAGSELMDLSSFEIPDTLLGILGLSQVVYVGGKLTAPPAISDLNKQIQKLRTAESDVSVSLSKVNISSLNHANVPMVNDPNVQSASVVYTDYLAQWDTSKTMFEATLGRLVPEWAQANDRRPPFEVPDLVKPSPYSLPNGTRIQAYAQNLTASGGTAPYTWTLVKGGLPPGLIISAQGQISGIPTTAGNTIFTLQVTDANGVCNSRTFVIKVQ